MVAVTAVACGPGYTPSNWVDRTRIVEARAHAPGDPSRAWMLPGETASIEYLVVSRTPQTDVVHTEFVACVQASTAGVNGIAGCAGSTFDAASGDIASSVAPAFTRTLEVPRDLMPGYSSYVLGYLGTCIGDGAPTLDPLAPASTCSGGAQSGLFRYLVQVVPDVRFANHNPNIHDEQYALGDVLWTEPTLGIPFVGCASMPPSSSLPFVRMSSHDSPTLVFGCSDDDREWYPAFDADMRPIMARERLDIAHYVTLGRIAGSTQIDDDTGEVVTTRWTRPTIDRGRNASDDAVLSDRQRHDLPSGLLVRFWFVARDHRSGADWVERDLCLVP